MEFFVGMADYQHVVPVHADIARRKRKNPSEMEEPHFQSNGLLYTHTHTFVYKTGKPFVLVNSLFLFL